MTWADNAKAPCCVPAWNCAAARRVEIRIEEFDAQPSLVLPCNNAVARGQSRIPVMRDMRRWGVATIGTCLGKAHFTNKEAPGGEAGDSDRQAA